MLTAMKIVTYITHGNPVPTLLAPEHIDDPETADDLVGREVGSLAVQ